MQKATIGSTEEARLPTLR